MGRDLEDDFYRPPTSRFKAASGSLIRLTLLFGSAVVGLALIAIMVINNHYGDSMADAGYGRGIDLTTTGSIGYEGSYVLRRSVLQPSPNSVCIIRDNGTRSGDC
jgi:hypothetical protein